MEELEQLTKQCKYLVKFLSSEHFISLIEAFVEEFCVIFSEFG